MNTPKPTKKQLDEIANYLSKDWENVINTVPMADIEFYRVQMLTNPDAVFETQKRLIACGMICFQKKDFESSTEFKRAAWLLSAFKAIADKKVVDGKVT